MKKSETVIAKNLKSTFDKLSNSKRGQVLLYLNLGAYKKFKKICDRKGLTSSRVIDEIILEYLKLESK